MSGNRELSVAFIGDIMCHGVQLQAAQNKSDGTYSFLNNFIYTKPHIQAADLAVCNLETTLAGKDFAGYPKFSTPDAIADAIADAGFQIVATANNHSNDTGTEGIVRTVEVLRSRGLSVIGTKATASDTGFAVTDVKGIRVAVLNYTYETAKYSGRKNLNNRALMRTQKSF